jgi:Fe-S-cluster containining protein
MKSSKASTERVSLWYQAGLRFECKACGSCCTGAPGYVWVGPKEAEKIASFLQISVTEFHVRFTRVVSGRISLKELANGDCIFFDPESRRCRIYPARPIQCQTWPFWNSNLVNREAWREVADRCPGCNSGRLFSVEEIERLRRQRDV